MFLRLLFPCQQCLCTLLSIGNNVRAYFWSFGTVPLHVSGRSIQRPCIRPVFWNTVFVYLQSLETMSMYDLIFGTISMQASGLWEQCPFIPPAILNNVFACLFARFLFLFFIFENHIFELLRSLGSRYGTARALATESRC